MVSQLVTLNEYSELPVKEPDWLIPNLIPREGLILLIGPPKEGKSFLALQLARDAAQAKPILGHEIDKPIVSLYLQLDARPRVWRIVTRSLKECGEDLSGPVFFVHPDNWGRYNILLESDRNILRSYVEQSQAELIILDVLREVHAVDENDSTTMKLVGDGLLSTFPKCSLLVIHHSRKIPPDVPNPDPMTYGRGSSYMVGKADAVWFLYKNKLRIVPRFDEDTTIEAVREESGFWSFPKLAELKNIKANILSLCKEFPELSHNQIAPIARDKFGISRKLYYQVLSSNPCKHTLH